MIFDQQLPSSSTYVAPRLGQTWLSKLAGLSASGQPNGMGKFLSWSPLGAGLGKLAADDLKRQGFSDSGKAADDYVQRSIQKNLAAVQVVGAVGSAVTGNVAGAAALGAGAFKTLSGLKAQGLPGGEFGSEYTAPAYREGGEGPPAKKTGPPTLYVDNPNDPRLRAYRDSSLIYNSDRILRQKLLSAGFSEEKPRPSTAIAAQGDISRALRMKPEWQKNAQVKHLRGGLYSLRDLYPDVTYDVGEGVQYFSPNIIPQGRREFGKYDLSKTFDEGFYDHRVTFDYSNAKPRQQVVLASNPLTEPAGRVVPVRPAAKSRPLPSAPKLGNDPGPMYDEGQVIEVPVEVISSRPIPATPAGDDDYYAPGQSSSARHERFLTNDKLRRERLKKDGVPAHADGGVIEKLALSRGAGLSTGLGRAFRANDRQVSSAPLDTLAAAQAQQSATAFAQTPGSVSAITPLGVRNSTRLGRENVYNEGVGTTALDNFVAPALAATPDARSSRLIGAAAIEDVAQTRKDGRQRSAAGYNLNRMFGGKHARRVQETENTMRWQVAQAGNPAIRSVRDVAAPEGMEAGNRAYYRPEQNTMYIGQFGDIQAEIPHAQQRKEAARFEGPSHIFELLNSPDPQKRMLGRRAYDAEMYDTPGTHEYDAHTIREPLVRRQLTGAYQKEVGKKLRSVALPAFARGGELINNEPLAITDQRTGQVRGTMDFNEGIFDQQATSTMKHLAAKKDYSTLGQMVAREMKTWPEAKGIRAADRPAHAGGGIGIDPLKINAAGLGLKTNLSLPTSLTAPGAPPSEFKLPTKSAFDWAGMANIATDFIGGLASPSKIRRASDVPRYDQFGNLIPAYGEGGPGPVKLVWPDGVPLEELQKSLDIARRNFTKSGQLPDAHKPGTSTYKLRERQAAEIRFYKQALSARQQKSEAPTKTGLAKEASRPAFQTGKENESAMAAPRKTSPAPRASRKPAATPPPAAAKPAAALPTADKLAPPSLDAMAAFSQTVPLTAGQTKSAQKLGIEQALSLGQQLGVTGGPAPYNAALGASLAGRSSPVNPTETKTQPGKPFDFSSVMNTVTDAGRLLAGVTAAQTPLPAWRPTDELTQYNREAFERRNQGLSEEELTSARQGLTDAQALQNAAVTSALGGGGNAGALAAGYSMGQLNRQQGERQLSDQDAQQSRYNFGLAGNALLQENYLDLQTFPTLYQTAAARQAGGMDLIQQTMADADRRRELEEYTREGGPYDRAVNRAKTQSAFFNQPLKTGLFSKS